MRRILKAVVVTFVLLALSVGGARPAAAEDFAYWMNLAESADEPADDVEYYTSALAAWVEADGLAGKAKAFKLRGWAHYRRQAWAKVVEDETSSIALADGDWETYHFRGWARYARKEYGEAAVDHERTVALHPGDPYLAFAVALCRLLEGRPKLAIEASQQSLAIDASFAMSHTNLGFAYFELKDYAAASASFDKAIELAGEGKSPDPGALVGRALVQWRQKHRREAIASLKEAVKLAPDLDALSIWMSMSRQYTPVQRKALAELKKAAKLR